MNKTNFMMFANRQKKKALALRTFAVAMFLALFTQFAQAQTSEILKMTNGSRQVPAQGFLFYDSGGPLLFDPNTDPDNANEYNWTTWYQHNEEYTMTLTVPDGVPGIQIEFTKLLINNDTLRFYEGNAVDPNKLIGEFCNNEYSTSFGNFTVTSHGSMTIRFVSDYHWRDEGWEALITRISSFVPQPPVAVVAACDNLVTIIPTCMGTDNSLTNVIQYKIGSGSYQNYTLGSQIDLTGQEYPVTMTVKATVDDVDSEEKTFTFAKEISAPNIPTYTLNASANSVTTYFPNKPDGVNDTYYIRWTIDNNATNNTPNLWDQTNEFQQPNNTPNTVPAGDIDYTNVTLSLPFYIHFATRGTTCPDKFSGVETVMISERYVPMPTISFETNGSNQGVTTLACSLDGATIYYTIDGSDPTTSSTQYTGTFTVAPGTTVKAIAVKTGYTTSAVASKFFVPNEESGNPQSGVYPGESGSNITTVLLDDREDHNWSYYSDQRNPIRKMKPADVKITYFGYGAETMTSTNMGETGLTDADFDADVAPGDVAVNHNESGNQFVYLKTLENAQENGGGNYPYTTIPNPFQKRPKYAPASGKGVNYFMEGMVDENGEVRGMVMSRSPKGYSNNEWNGEPRGNRAVTYEKVTSSQSDWSGNYLLAASTTSADVEVFNGTVYNNVYTLASNTSTNTSVGSFEYLTQSSNVISSTTGDEGDAAILTIAPVTESGYTSYYTIRINGGNYLGSTTTGGMITNSTANSTSYYWNISYNTSTSSMYLYSVATNSSTYKISYFVEDDNGTTYGGFCSNQIYYSGSTFEYNNVAFYKETSSGSIDCNTEEFTSYTAASYNETGSLPTGWKGYSTNTNRPPHVSNNSTLGTSYDITGLGGVGSTNNFLYMIGNTTSPNNSYTILPQYPNLTSFEFDYAYESTGNGTLSVGYCTSNTSGSSFTAFTDITITAYTASTHITLTAADINTINNNNGYITFRWNCSSAYGVGIDNVKVCTEDITTYTITATANPTAGGTVTGGGSFAENASCTLVATPSEHYEFTNWTEGGTIVSTNPTYTFTVDGNHTFVANFTELPQYTITVNASPAAGGTVSGGGTYYQGTEITLIAEVNTGYTFNNWTLNGNPVSSNLSYTFTVSGNATYTANFIHITGETVPFCDDFESGNTWQLVNGSQTNKWVRGTAAHNGTGSYGLYISNDNGSSNAYSNTNSMVYAYKMFTLAAGTYTVKYDWRSNGQNQQDYMRVALVPDGTALTAGTTPTGFSYNSLPTGWLEADNGQMNQNNSWTTGTEFDVTVATAGDYCLVFAWKNNNTTLYQYPAAIDNVCVSVATPKFDVTIASGIQYGSISSSHARAEEGTTVTITATPDSGYNLGTITVMGTSGTTYSVSISGTTGTFTMPGENVTVNATFYDPTQTYRGFYAWRVKRLSDGLKIKVNGDEYGSSQISSIPYINAETEVEFITSNAKGNEVDFEALWAQAWVTTTTNTSNLHPAAGYERNFMVLSSNPGTNNSTSYLPSQSGNSGYDNGRYVPLYINRDSGYGYSISQQIYTAAEIGASGSITSIGFRVQNSRNSDRTLHIYMSSTSKTAFDYSSDWSAYESETVSASELVYSGRVNFNSTGWKTITLDTPFVYDGSSNIIVTVFDATGTYMSTSPRFYTYSGAAVYNSRNSGAYTETGYYYAMYQSNYKPQIQFTFTTSTVSGLAVPLTMTTRNPDGTGGSTTVTLTNAIECGADLKIENIKMNAISSINANGKNLAIGRGVEAATSGGLCANGVLGLSAASTTSFNLRIESGYYNYLYLMGQYGLTSNGIEKVTLGSDYDRANNKDNSKLRVFNDVVLSEGGSVGTSGTVGDQRCICTVKSGNFDLGTYGEDHQFYMSAENGTMYAGRTLIIEGGLFSDVAGGLDAETSSTNQDKFTLRIKGGTFKGAVFGAAQYASAYGNRRFVITGGEFQGWIAGGANGTREDRGDLNGTSAIYVGGKAQVNSNGSTTVLNRAVGGNVFGAGCGYSNTSTSGQVTGGTTVVIADQALVERGVYGGGSYGYTTATANVHVLGGTVNAAVGGVNGTTYSTAIIGGVYGGACQNQGGITNVTMKNGTVNGNIYGGSNALGDISGLATVNVTGGTVNNVFGGGYGSDTEMQLGTKVNVSGGTINNNVYGGGEEGEVTAVGTSVNIGGGTMKNVFGAGKGDATHEAKISGPTTVIVNGGTMDNVYGGGENGAVEVTGLASTVTIQGGTINADVFGGGKMGHTIGNVTVNVFEGSIAGNVYGGAFGKKDQVFVEGTHTVNITGGNIYTNVYGGSRNADDALTDSPTGGETDAINRVNISGGHIYYQVFASGYFGHTYGSVYAFIGKNAIENAPNSQQDPLVSYNSSSLLIDGSVWAGADFGNFDGNSFGANTIEGYSNVYIDGTGYNTESTSPSDAGYMNIGGSVIGSGTSCYAGIEGSDLIFRNYGKPIRNPNYSGKDDEEPIVEPYNNATRHLMSVQFFDNAIIDNVHMQLVGQGKINSLVTTEKFSLYEIDKVLRVVNGSTLIFDFPVDQILKMGSYTCSEVYATTPSFTVVNYTDLPTEGHDNKFRVNNGAFINIKYTNGYGEGKDYGELEGFSYMMTEDVNNTCAYARPKQSTDLGNQIPNDYNNPNDGGFLSYDADMNTYNISGGTANPGVQMPYENHTLTSKYGEQYFRIWRYGGIHSYREGVFNAIAKTEDGYSTADVIISLPASRGDGSYFRIQSVSNYTTIDYGTDVMTVNAGVYNSTNGTPEADGWMYYDNTSHEFVEGQAATQTNVAAGLSLLNENVNANFGLVAIPQGSLVGTNSQTLEANQNWLICTAADGENELLPVVTWTNNDQVVNPSILFRLTYNNALTNNVTWDPIIITLEQCTANGTVKDEIKIALSVNTSTTIDQDFTAQAYAVMNGKGNTTDTYTAKVVLPGYIPYVNTEGDLSDWTFKSAVWTPAVTEFNNAWKQGSGYINNPAANNQFSMQIQPSSNFDNSVGWATYDHTAKDLYYLQNGSSVTEEEKHLAYSDGRNPAALDFILHFDGTATCNAKELMGVLTVTLHFTNYKYGDASDDYSRDLVIDIEVYRRGAGLNYYLDGVNGDNFFSGTYPNAAKKTLSGIFNRSEYLPGDNIFIVNTVTANGSSTLDWNGELYDGVILYRYPGGHQLMSGGTEAEMYQGYTTDYNPDNVGFAGPLVVVEKTMDMHGIILDGFYHIQDTTTIFGTGGNDLYPVDNKYITPTAPLINIAADGSLTLYAGSELRWNYSNSNGGAVYNAGSLILRDGAVITDNAVLSNNYNGAGIYLANNANLTVSDMVTVSGNHIGAGGAKDGAANSNVYLSSANSMVQVGTVDPTDGISALDNNARIGVTKGQWGNYYYTPIAYSDGGTDYLGNLTHSGQNHEDCLIFDDEDSYHLIALSNTPGYDPSYNYLFWVGTWVTKVNTKPSTYDGTTDPVLLTTREDLAWAISVVNGLNEQTAAPATNFKVVNDLNMGANIWVPMGTVDNPYTGTFDGNGHLIDSVRSPLNNENMGMFGVINATVSDMMVNVVFKGGNSVRMGAVAAVMQAGTISNVEAGGAMDGTESTTEMGGLVGKMVDGIVHSSFAVNTMSTENPDTYMGGLVGLNGGNLLNSYANTTMSGSSRMGGLVGENGSTGLVENCYSVIGSQTFPAFAYLNKGTVKLCYAENNVTNYVVDNTAGTLSGHGNYAATDPTHTYGYMYWDNAVTVASEQTNPCVVDTIKYKNNQIARWPGLLSTLEYWVDSINAKGGDITYTKWLRPTTKNINDDLPVLCFPKDNCMITTDSEGKALRYGPFDGSSHSAYMSRALRDGSDGFGNQGFGQEPVDSSSGDDNIGNGVDHLLEVYEDMAGHLFVYDNAINVERVPNANLYVYINEDVAFKQAADADEFINTQVGVSFDNSHGKATDFFGNTLAYDWHMLSTPLANAPLGIRYNDSEQNWWETSDDTQVSSVANSYMPDGTGNDHNWDLYSFYEPEYHWINLKRNSGSHHHYDENASGVHELIEYTNETTFEPGKGYMAAIKKDSYLCNNGTLNGPANPVSITLTKRSHDPGTEELGYNLIGNPYQAYLDVNKFLGDNSLSSYWVYVAEDDNYIAGNADASVNPALPSATLHPHQGFFVLANSDEQTVNFDYSSMALTDPVAQSYFRGEKVNYPLVNLFATNEKGKKDLTVIEFNRPVFGGSYKMNGVNNANFSLASHLHGESYSILFTEEGTEKIPVHFTTNETGTYTLTWDTYHGTFSSLYLVDNMTGTHTNMLQSDHYTFTSSPDDYASRFYITFKCIGVDEYTEGDGDFAWFDGSDWIINGKGQLQLVDVLGHVLQSQYVNGDQNRLHLDGYAAGVYMLHLSNGKTNKVQKIVVR